MLALTLKFFLDLEFSAEERFTNGVEIATLSHVAIEDGYFRAAAVFEYRTRKDPSFRPGGRAVVGHAGIVAFAWQRA